MAAAQVSAFLLLPLLVALAQSPQTGAVRVSDSHAKFRLHLYQPQQQYHQSLALLQSQENLPVTSTSLPPTSPRGERLDEYRAFIKSLTSCSPHDIERLLSLPFLKYLARNNQHNASNRPHDNIYTLDSRGTFKNLQPEPPPDVVSSQGASAAHVTIAPSDFSQAPNDDAAAAAQSSNGDKRQTKYQQQHQPNPNFTFQRPTSAHTIQPSRTSSNTCTLGNDTYAIGDRWSPIVPPFGMQVCVQCDCIVVQKKNCYETRTTCKRISNECPIITTCPNGQPPVAVEGKCCKSCESVGDKLTFDSNQKPFSEIARHQQLTGSLELRLQQYLAIMRNSSHCQQFQTTQPSIQLTHHHRKTFVKHSIAHSIGSGHSRNFVSTNSGYQRTLQTERKVTKRMQNQWQ